MFGSVSKRIGWWTVENQFEATRVLPGDVAKQRKKVKRRTQILNKELKKFATLRSYSRYVRIKTKILRNVSDNENTENESLSLSEESSPEVCFSAKKTGESKSSRVRCEEKRRTVPGDGGTGKNLSVSTELLARARVKRNLTSLLDSLETTNIAAGNTRTDETVNDDDKNNYNYSNNNNNNNSNRSERFEKGANESPIVQIVNAPAGDSGIDENSQDNSSTSNRENENLTELDWAAETIDQRDLPLESTETNEETVRDDDLEKSLVNEEEEKEKEEEEEEKEKEEEEEEFGAMDERTRKSQPIITHTEIVKSRYTIIREETAKCREERSMDDEIVQNNEELIDFYGISRESKRVGQLKRLNLTWSGSESDDSSNDNEILDVPPIGVFPKSSQVISDITDSEDGDVSSEFLHITDSDDSRTGKILDHRDQGEKISSVNANSVRSEIKSIKDQIEEQQEVVDSSLLAGEKTARDETKEGEEFTRAPFSFGYKEDGLEREKQGPSDADSLRYVLRNIEKRRINEDELDVSCIDDTRQPIANNEEKLSRPTEMGDFIAREGLVPVCESSTITVKDIATKSTEQDEDLEIWLMEIPRSILKDPHVCGKSMVIEERKMRIGEASYDIALRNDQSLSCILRRKIKKAQYKPVNIRPVCSIIVRQESVEKESLVAAAPGQSAEKSVPAFPKNLKSRNPLVTSDKWQAPSSKATHRNADGDKKRRRKMTKRGPWHLDNFISKSKKKRIDFA